MTTAMPFSLTDLTENRPGETCEGAKNSDRDQNGSVQVPQCRSMEFNLFGADAGKSSDPERIYTADDLARAVDDAKRTTAIETEATLRSSIANEIEQRQCDMLSAIKEQLEQSGSAFDEELARLAAVSHGLAVALAKAIIPRAIEHRPFVDITDALKVTIASLATAPAIELRLHPSLVESGETIMADLTKEVGFAGEVVTVADPTLGEGDTELRWKNGMLSRRVNCLQAEAFELADRWLQRQSESAGADASASSSASLKPESAGDLPDQVIGTGTIKEGTK